MEKEKLQTRPAEEGDEEEKVTVSFSNAQGARHEFLVSKGKSVKELLKELGHKAIKGLIIKVNNKMIQADEETGELLEDVNLEENSVLVIQQTFTGGDSLP